MEHIKKILGNQELYLRYYGRPNEENHSLNDMNRDLIIAMHNYYGHVYVASINGGTGLLQYDPGKKIYNSEYNICVPDYDAQLDDLLRLWEEEHNTDHLEAIYARLRAISGHLLLWV